MGKHASLSLSLSPATIMPVAAAAAAAAASSQDAAEILYIGNPIQTEKNGGRRLASRAFTFTSVSTYAFRMPRGLGGRSTKVNSSFESCTGTPGRPTTPAGWLAINKRVWGLFASARSLHRRRELASSRLNGIPAGAKIAFEIFLPPCPPSFSRFRVCKFSRPLKPHTYALHACLSQ